MSERKVRAGRQGFSSSRRGVPRWPAAVALSAIGASYIALTGYVTFGPRVWLPGLMAVLVVPLLIAHAGGCWAHPEHGEDTEHRRLEDPLPPGVRGTAATAVVTP